MIFKCSLKDYSCITLQPWHFIEQIIRSTVVIFVRSKMAFCQKSFYVHAFLCKSTGHRCDNIVDQAVCVALCCSPALCWPLCWTSCCPSVRMLETRTALPSPESSWPASLPAPTAQRPRPPWCQRSRPLSSVHWLCRRAQRNTHGCRL